jgi:2'-5' RNA ligase
MVKRLFIAIKVEPGRQYLEEFRAFRSALRGESIKWVEERNIHLTLKFIGETDESRIPAILNALEPVALRTPAFTFSLGSIGIFGSSYSPRVIWAGINPYDRLALLMQEVHKALEPVGFPRDRQNLVPHLTLGRIRFLRDKPSFQETLRGFHHLESEPITARQMILFESILKKEGPEYVVLRVLAFQK